MKKINQIVGLLIITVMGFCVARSQDSFSRLDLSGLSDNGVLELSGTNISSFKTFSDAELTALVDVLIATPTVSSPSLPNGCRMPGTFWSLQYPGMPPLPADTIGVGVWPMADGSFLLDDWGFDYSAISVSSMGMRAMGYPAPPGFGDGGTNIFEYSFNAQVFTTNDLWLQILSVTNQRAKLVIHSPSNVTNNAYDLIYCTNLLPPVAWQWLLRTSPGETNLVVTNVFDPQGFYALGVPNDIIASDSLGTNFWVMFYSLYAAAGMSLYISSEIGATGSVTIPGLGFTNNFTILAGTVTNISIPTTAMSTNYDGVENNGINIVTTSRWRSMRLIITRQQARLLHATRRRCWGQITVSWPMHQE
jgi:hypothetical protein